MNGEQKIGNENIFLFEIKFYFDFFLHLYRIIPGDEVARNLSGPSRPTVYKRRPSSPSPNEPQRSIINAELNAIRGKLNPVKELQLLARQNSNNDEVN